MHPAVRRCGFHSCLLLWFYFQRDLVLHQHVVQEVLFACLAKYFSVSPDSRNFSRGIRSAYVGCAPVSVKGSAV